MIALEWRGMRRIVQIVCALRAGRPVFRLRLSVRWRLEKSHGRYQESVRQVDEEQVLRNIVHLRYSEVPLELSVSSIAAQYELAGAAEARPFFIAPNPSNSNIIFKTFTSILPDLLVSGANRPTITLLPGDNSETIKRFLTPVPMETLLFLTETSWPVAVILRLWVERLNGVPNAVTASGPARGVISDFQRFRRLAELFQYAQDHEMGSLRSELRDTPLSGPIPAESVTAATVVEAAKAGMEYRPSQDGPTWTLIRKQNKMMLRINPEALDSPEMEEVTSLMNLRPGQLYYDVVVAPGDRSRSASLSASPFRRVADHASVDLPGLLLPIQRRGGPVRTPGMRRGQADGGRRGKTHGRQRTDPWSVRGPRLQRPQAPILCLRRDQEPRVLVLHRRPRSGEQVDARSRAPAQPARLRHPEIHRPNLDSAGRPVKWGSRALA